MSSSSDEAIDSDDSSMEVDVGMEDPPPPVTMAQIQIEPEPEDEGQNQRKGCHDHEQSEKRSANEISSVPLLPVSPPPPPRQLRKRKQGLQYLPQENDGMDMDIAGKTRFSAQHNGVSKRKKLKMESADGLRKATTSASNSLPSSNAVKCTWDDFLWDPWNAEFVAGVELFKHAPLVDIWNDLVDAAIDQKIEIINGFIECPKPVFWVATVLQFAGYKALVLFERFGLPRKYIEWINYCSSIPKPLGYSYKNGFLLYPTKEVSEIFPKFRKMLAVSTKGASTVTKDHAQFIKNNIKSCQRYPVKTKLEVLDKTCVSRMRVATVKGTIGDKIHVTYDIEPRPRDAGFWFSVNSDAIHLPGWCAEVGHELYDGHCTVPSHTFTSDDFPAYPKSIVLAEGQILEARHPIAPFHICQVRIVSVLQHGYFMVEFITWEDQKQIHFNYCFHVTSPYIFPSGFCKAYGIPLLECCSKTAGLIHISDKIPYAPLNLLPRRQLHFFKLGMKLECIDVVDPLYIGPATVIKVAGHMLLLHYDGWPRGVPAHTAWMDNESPDIAPLGYADLLGLKFQDIVDLPDPNDLTVHLTAAEIQEVKEREEVQARVEEYGSNFVGDGNEDEEELTEDSDSNSIDHVEPEDQEFNEGDESDDNSIVHVEPLEEIHDEESDNNSIEHVEPQEGFNEDYESDGDTYSNERVEPEYQEFNEGDSDNNSIEHVEPDDDSDNNSVEHVEPDDESDNNSIEHVETDDESDNNSIEHVETADQEELDEGGESDKNSIEHVEPDDKEEFSDDEYFNNSIEHVVESEVINRISESGNCSPDSTSSSSTGSTIDSV